MTISAVIVASALIKFVCIFVVFIIANYFANNSEWCKTLKSIHTHLLFVIVLWDVI